MAYSTNQGALTNIGLIGFGIHVDDNIGLIGFGIHVHDNT